MERAQCTYNVNLTREIFEDILNAEYGGRNATFRRKNGRTNVCDVTSAFRTRHAASGNAAKNGHFSPHKKSDTRAGS